MKMKTTSTCTVCRVMELSSNEVANEATQYFCKAIRCTEMLWWMPKFLMQYGGRLIDNLPWVIAFLSQEAKSVINTNQPSGSMPFPAPFLPPNFHNFELIYFIFFSTDINDSRDKFQLKDLQAVIYSYTMDASPEKVLEKHIRLTQLLEIYKTIYKCICKFYYWSARYPLYKYSLYK